MNKQFQQSEDVDNLWQYNSKNRVEFDDWNSILLYNCQVVCPKRYLITFLGQLLYVDLLS